MSITNRSGIQCLQHPNQQITNFCIQYDCLKPLCPDCVQIHTKFHDKQQIQSWKHCLNKSVKSIQSTLQTLKQIYDQQNKYKPYKNIETVENQNIKILHQMKNKVHKIVDQIFLNHQQHLRSLIRNQYKIDLPDLTKLKAAIQQMEKLLMKLGHAGTILTAIRKSLLLDHQSLLKYFGQMRFKQFKHVNQIFIYENHDIYPQIREILSKTINLQALKETQNQQRYHPSTPLYNKHNNSIEQSQNSNNIFQPIKITLKNYFNDSCKNKKLHFFVPQSNELKMLDIMNVQKNNLKWQSLLFNTTRQVPSYSKSIITQNGQIFLTGGSGNQKRFKQIYQYNYESNTIDLVCKMKYQRSSHAICYSNGIIYIIGGFSQNQNDGEASKTCQIFSIKDKKCTQIASLNAPSANSCAVVFNDEYIFKFGGIENKIQGNNIIQMYSIKKNKWYTVQIQLQRPTSKLQLLSFSAGIQINPSQLLIFGGYDNSDTQKPSRSCYIAQVNLNNNKISVRIKNFNHKPLINPQGFWNNNPILWNSKVIALQNITDQQNQLTALKDQRKVIIFDGKSWN